MAWSYIYDLLNDENLNNIMPYYEISSYENLC